ncbi:MAG: class I SAM-dependent methyltransferase [Candidatus Vogelbacteria bacterium]|nr:class I SAM-dependent methyltransferase [Candidatus Vogelbacteria bacterium]
MINKYLNRIKYALWQMRITAGFNSGLRHNFHELTWLERIAYLIFKRPKLTEQQRFFYEGHWGLRGQMYSAERKCLYDTILNNKPRFCLEIGTYTGGGSTFFLASAFKKVGQGKLHTLETEDYFFQKAKKYYLQHLPRLTPFIEFYKGSDIGKFKQLLDENGGCDCALLDGAEDGKETLRQYEFLKPYFRHGSLLIMHDWNTAKTEMIRPAIQNEPRWKLITELRPPESVGMTVFRYE